MPGSSLWDSEKVKIKRMPTLQDALCACDREILMRVLLDAGEAYGLRGSRKAARKRLSSTLGVMQALSLDDKAGRGHVLFPLEVFVLQHESLHIVRRLEATLLFKRDLPSMRSVLARSEAGDDVGLDDGLGHGYAVRPWEETLASKVWLAGPWCRRDRYETLAAAFWEMTSLGFEYERAHAHMMHEKATRLVRGRCEPNDEAGRVRTVSDVRRQASMEMGLVEPDHFQLDYRRRLMQTVAALNRTAHVDFYGRVLDWERRVENGSTSHHSPS